MQYEYPPEVWEKIRRILSEILTKAISDHKFREQCVSNPPAAFEEITGKDLPKGAELRLVEPGASELTDADIIKVAQRIGKLPDESPEGNGPLPPYGSPHDWLEFDEH